MYLFNREVQISLQQLVRERQLDIAVVFVTVFTQIDERLVASISSSTTTTTTMNQGRTQEMITSAHKHFVLVLVVAVKS